MRVGQPEPCGPTPIAPTYELRIAVLNEDIEDNPLFNLEPCGRAPARPIWRGSVLEDNTFAVLFPDPKCPQARGILRDGNNGNPLGVEGRFQLLQTLPAIDPGL